MGVPLERSSLIEFQQDTGEEIAIEIPDNQVEMIPKLGTLFCSKHEIQSLSI